MRWLNRLARPQLVVGLLALAASLVLLTGPAALKRGELRSFETTTGSSAPPLTSELRLIIIDGSGLERPRFVNLEHGPDPASRLTALTEALRSELIGDGVWPASLAAPTVYLVENRRLEAAVLDFAESDVSLTIAQERQIVASLRETLLRNGVDSVQFLVAGEARPAPLGHLAVPTGL